MSSRIIPFVVEGNLGSNSNLIITGGNANNVLTTDGTGNLSWTAPVGGATGATGATGPAGAAGNISITQWSSPSSMPANSLVVGTMLNYNNTFYPGTQNNIQITGYPIVNTTATVSNLNNEFTQYFIYNNLYTTYFDSQVLTTSDGITWISSNVSGSNDISYALNSNSNIVTYQFTINGNLKFNNANSITQFYDSNINLNIGNVLSTANRTYLPNQGILHANSSIIIPLLGENNVTAFSPALYVIYSNNYSNANSYNITTNILGNVYTANLLGPLIYVNNTYVQFIDEQFANGNHKIISCYSNNGSTWAYVDVPEIANTVIQRFTGMFVNNSNNIILYRGGVNSANLFIEYNYTTTTSDGINFTIANSTGNNSIYANANTFQGSWGLYFTPFYTISNTSNSTVMGVYNTSNTTQSFFYSTDNGLNFTFIGNTTSNSNVQTQGTLFIPNSGKLVMYGRTGGWYVSNGNQATVNVAGIKTFDSNGNFYQLANTGNYHSLGMIGNTTLLIKDT